LIVKPKWSLGQGCCHSGKQEETGTEKSHFHRMFCCERLMNMACVLPAYDNPGFHCGIDFLKDYDGSGPDLVSRVLKVFPSAAVRQRQLLIKVRK
jgi:hypothetical protein